jgi:hypothetical protein
MRSLQEARVVFSRRPPTEFEAFTAIVGRIANPPSGRNAISAYKAGGVHHNALLFDLTAYATIRQQPRVGYCFLRGFHRRLDDVQAAGGIDRAAHGFQVFACPQPPNACQRYDQSKAVEGESRPPQDRR